MILGAEDSAADGRGTAGAGPARSAGREDVRGEKIGSAAGAPPGRRTFFALPASFAPDEV